jgi:hypothetical protein
LRVLCWYSRAWFWNVLRFQEKVVEAHHDRMGVIWRHIQHQFKVIAWSWRK